MSNICKTVSLRTRKIKDGHMLSYYLDYYPGYRDESTMKVIRHESLGIHTMLCSCLEASLPVLLSYGIEKERHQETHLGGDTAIRQRWCDVCHHTNAEDKGHRA